MIHYNRKRSIVISYDSRIKSDVFSKIAAEAVEKKIVEDLKKRING